MGFCFHDRIARRRRGDLPLQPALRRPEREPDLTPCNPPPAASDYRNAFDSRRNSYGQGLVLLNNVSHDEQSYSDPYQALIRYAVCGTIDGAPMIFYGEELGISTYFGFDEYQLNFGKTIPQFMNYNSLQPIFLPPTGTTAWISSGRSMPASTRRASLVPLCAARTVITSTRPAAGIHSLRFLRGQVRQRQHLAEFLRRGVRLCEPRSNDPQPGYFNINITQNGANLFGIKPGRIYNVKNIAAYTGVDPNRRNYWLWNGGAGGVAGSNVLANGVSVALNPVPTTNGGWTSAPFEAQYLKLYDVARRRARCAHGHQHPGHWQHGDLQLGAVERSGRRCVRL